MRVNDARNKTNSIPLPWNKFRFISDDKSRWALQVKFTLTSRVLSAYPLPPKQGERIELIYELSERGLSNQQIAAYFNERNIPTIRNKRYTQKLIWAILKKYEARKERLLDTRYEIDEILPVILVTELEHKRYVSGLKTETPP